jgi:hypothetical protein
MASTDQFREADPQLDAVLADLRGGVAGHVRSPGTAAVRRTVHRRRVAQRTAAAVAAVAVIAGVATAALAVKPPRDAVVPATPTPSAAATQSPSPGPSPSATAENLVTAPGLDQVDWRNAKLALPAIGGCPARTVTFKNGRAGKMADHDPSWKMFESGARDGFTKPVYADVLGDSGREALVEVDCYTGYPSEFALVAFTGGSGGVPQGAGVVTSAGPDAQQWLHSASVKGRTVTVEINGLHPATNATQTTIRRMTWNGTRFVRADPKLAILDADRRKAVYTVPALDTCAAYSGVLPSSGTDTGWDLSLPSSIIVTPVLGDLDGDGVSEQLMIAICMKEFSTGWGTTHEVVVALKLKPGGRIGTLGTIAAAPAGGTKAHVTAMSAANGKVTVTYSTGAKASYRWNGSAFVTA